MTWPPDRAEWALERLHELRKLRGQLKRCWWCGYHEPTQGHAGDCQRPLDNDIKRRRRGTWLHAGNHGV